MSTSPSWFDQEKFSRLVKKVGPKSLPEALPAPPGSEVEHRPITGEGLVPTAHISLVSKPPSLLSENRALPALPRRTSPLPSLRALFPYPGASRSTSTPQQPSAENFPGGEEAVEETADTAHHADSGVPFGQEVEDLAAVWQKMALLNEELARVTQERDQAVNEGVLLREQLRQADEAFESREGAGAPAPSGAGSKDLDDALAEGQALREQLRQARASVKETGAAELASVIGERDQARREYAALRKEFETYKQEQNPREESTKFRKEWEQQLEELQQKVEERDREIAAFKADSGGAPGGGEEKFQAQITLLREQLARAKDEASVAQRGLALSQKALHQTRDTLREATEGTSLSRHNSDNLKNECAILAQQNSVLQAQNDQLSRDLATAKSKLTSRL